MSQTKRDHPRRRSIEVPSLANMDAAEVFLEMYGFSPDTRARVRKIILEEVIDLQTKGVRHE